MYKKHFESIILICILAVAAFLRLYKIADYMTFLGDEGRDVLVVYNILHGHLTLLGPTSSVGGFFLGPVYYYFMAPFLFLSHYNPVGPAIMIGLLGVVTVWFVYKLGKEFFTTAIGLTAAFLYTISPLVIAYSRSSWNPNPMPFFTMLTVYVLYRAIKADSSSSDQRELRSVHGKSMWLFILCGALLGIQMQLHYLATFVGVIIFVYVLISKFIMFDSFTKSRSFLFLQSVKEYVYIFFGFLIGFSPFLAFEARHDFLNIKSIFQFVFHSKDVSGGGNFFITVQNVFFRLFGRLITDFPPPEQVSLQAHPTIFIWYILTWILAVLSFGYFVFLFVTTVKNKDERVLQFLLFFIWFVTGVFLFGFYKKQIYDYYFGFLFPVPFFFVSIFFSFLWKNIYLRIIAVGIFFILVYINIQAMPFRYPPNRQLMQIEDISKFVLSKTGGKPYNFALITGGNSDYGYRYFFTMWNHPPVTMLNPDTDPQRKSVQDQLLVVCETLPCAPLGDSLWEVAGFGRAEIADKWDVSVVEVYRLVHYKGKK